MSKDTVQWVSGLGKCNQVETGESEMVSCGKLRGARFCWLDNILRACF